MKSSLYIVDDEEDILISLLVWFKKLGYKVKTFSNSKELLVVYSEHKPDLILLDVNLNGEDGRDICKFIKDKLQFQSPVLLFSANPYNGENYKHYQADGFLCKPFTLSEISKFIASHIEH